MADEVNIPLIMTAEGPRPTPPALLRLQLVTLVTANAPPGYTADLPASLIEDVVSTGVGALSMIDQMRVDLINSITPYGANLFLLTQLGNIYGSPIGIATNATVDLVFTGEPGYAIDRGFVVSDGTYQYVVITGGIIGQDGNSSPISARATTVGIWPIPAGSVTTIVTSLPFDVTLTVTNPLAGTSGLPAQTEGSYRAQVLEAGLAASQGMARYLKTLLKNVDGVVDRLIAVQQQVGGGWKVIVGGGDNYEVADAIWRALFDVSTLVGSTMAVIDFTAANPGVVETALNHGLTTGASATIAGVDPSDYNGTYTITVIDEKHFSVGADTSGFDPYVSGGVVTPNPRNVIVDISDYPDVYGIPIVRPPAQDVAITATWNTTATNFTGAVGVAQLAAPAMVDYINSIAVGQPINLLTLGEVFAAAISALLPPELLTRLVFAVSINGIPTAPDAGTEIVEGDPESYFTIEQTAVTIVQG